MATGDWNRILNPDQTYKETYGQSSNNVVTGGRNAFSNYGAEIAEKENVQFMFPGPTFTDIENRTHVMRRGFIRSIIFDPEIYNNYATAGNFKAIAGQSANARTPIIPTEMSKGHHRVNFQFNPEYLERAVKQEMGTMNPLLQNPANLTQAVPGTAKFGFSLMFNRELEVQRGAIKGKQFTINYENPDFESIYKSADPETIGVLADLLIFDSIIGQGISPDTVEAINAFTNNIVNAANSVKTEVQKIDKDGKPKYIEDPNNKGAYIPEMVEQGGTLEYQQESFLNNLNYGNSAFLNPLPVRIVFSDFFMVEGLVTASTVGFQKFSKDLIPTVCTVNIAVDALYIGFAQKKAYLTNQLSIAAEGEATNAQKNAEEANNAKTSLTRYFSEITYLVNESGTTLPTVQANRQQPQNAGRQDRYLWVPQTNELSSVFKYRFWKSRYPDATRTSVADFTNAYGDTVYPGYAEWSGIVGADLIAFITYPMWVLGCQWLSNSAITGVPDIHRKNGWMKNDNTNYGYVPIQIAFKNPSGRTTDTSYDWEKTYNPGGTAPTFEVTSTEIIVKYEDKNGIELPDKQRNGTIAVGGSGEIKDIRKTNNKTVVSPYLVGTIYLGNQTDFGGALVDNVIYKYNAAKTVFLKEIEINIKIRLKAVYKASTGDLIDIYTNDDFMTIPLRYDWDTPFVGKNVFRQTMQVKSTN